MAIYAQTCGPSRTGLERELGGDGSKNLSTSTDGTVIVTRLEDAI